MAINYIIYLTTTLSKGKFENRRFSIIVTY